MATQYGKCAVCDKCDKATTAVELWAYTFPQHNSFLQYCYTHGLQGLQWICRPCFDKYTVRPYKY